MSNQNHNAVNEALGIPTAEALERALEEAIDEERAVVLAMVDLDHFMRVNTEFGHEEGDRVIIDTGRYLAAGLPKDATLYRYGGDEFACLFPETYEKEDAFLRMESLRKDYALTLPDNTRQTITMGIAAAQDDAPTCAELIRKAEGAMFRGKMAGHDRVCLARDDKMVTKTSHYTAEQLKRLTKVSAREGIGEAVLLREALDALLKKYDA